MKALFIFITGLLIILPLDHLWGQNMHLRILKGDDEIGIIDVRKIEQADSLSFVSESTLNFSFIWDYEWRSTVVSVLKNSEMSWSRLVSFLNDKPRDDKYTYRNGTGYQCRNFDDSGNAIENAIDFTTLMLYFREPIGIADIYSERFQSIVKLEPLKTHAYKIAFPNGDVNHYYYDTNGQLLKVDAFRRWFDLVFLPET
jgi:hypothetical protein